MDGGISERTACYLAGISRSYYKYQNAGRADPYLIRAILAIKEKYPKLGYKKIAIMVNRKGFNCNHKKAHRIIKTLNMLVPKKAKKRKRFILKVEKKFLVPTKANDLWAMDFISGTLTDGCKFRCLTVVDTLTRIIPIIYPAFSMEAFVVVRILEDLKKSGNISKAIIFDNGPEFANHAVVNWAYTNGIRLHFIDPGKPTQNGFIESFNGKFRSEFLDTNEFSSMKDLQVKLKKWIYFYNNERPHLSLDYLTPMEFEKTLKS